jgi:hypothetical protein
MKRCITIIRAGFFSVLLALFTACASRPSIYSWGQYENLIYNTYNDPGRSAPEMEIEKMEKDFQKARSQNKPVHPGFHAHLGYLYYQVGKVDGAGREFETEKAQFPESSVFMDQLLARLQKK